MSSKKMEYYPHHNFARSTQNFGACMKTVSDETPFHWHDYFECEIVLSGSAEHRFNNTTEIIRPGSAYLLSYFDSHAVKPHTDMKIFSIQFNENMLPDGLVQLLLFENRNCYCSFEGDEFEYIHRRIERIEAEDPCGEFYYHMMTALITEIILLIIRNSPIDTYTTMPTPVQQAKMYVIRHFREHISLKSAAERLSLTPKYLGSVFKKNTGIYFNSYLNNIRLKYACNLLDTSDLTVKEIAFSSGYASVEYFLDVFKRRMNVTPMEYRGMRK